MQSVLLRLFLVFQTLPVLAVEHVFDFSDCATEQTPPGFRSVVAGPGLPGNWSVCLDEVPPLSSTSLTSTVRQAVLTQTARDAVRGHCPVLFFERETYSDFKFSARFKITGGTVEQTVGLVFRYQNESNFYAVAASSLDKTFRCHKLLNGEWKPPMGSDVEISTNAWHEMSVECEETRIICSLDGKPVIKLIDALAERSGKIGFWTRADSAGCFTDAKISFKIQEVPAQKLVRDALKEYPRLLGLKIYATASGGGGLVVVASANEKERGQAGGVTEKEVISQGTVRYVKDKDSTRVTMPLCDRNGEPIAAVCVVLKSNLGQAEDNAVQRARPVVRLMQERVRSLEDLVR